MKLIVSLILTSTLHYGGAFAPRSMRGNLPSSTVSSFFGKPHTIGSTELRVGAELDPEDMIPLGQDCSITPEGFGFSSSVERILKQAGRKSFYRAKASDFVADVMEGITTGESDVALVFDDETGKLVGIFTESDYIKVRILQGQ